MEAARGIHRADGTGGAGANRCDRGAQMEAGAGAAGRISKSMRSGDRVGIAAMRLVGGQRDILKVYIRIDAMELLGRDDIGIDAESALHGDIGAESLDVGLTDHDSESSLDKPAFATDDIGPIPEVSTAGLRESDLRREGIMHADQRSGACRHPGADVAPFEDVDARARARQMHREAASDDAGANNDYADGVRGGHIFCTEKR